MRSSPYLTFVIFPLFLALNGCGGGGGSSQNTPPVITPPPQPTPTYTVGGTVYGVTDSGLVLSLNDNEEISIETNGQFSFDQELTDSSEFVVNVKTLPIGSEQTCVVFDGVGSVDGQDFTSVSIECKNIFVTQAANDKTYSSFPQEISLSNKAQHIAFTTTEAGSFFSDSTTVNQQIVLYDSRSAIFELASINRDGESGIFSSMESSISGDGNITVFLSEAKNLDPNSDVVENFNQFIYIRNRQENTTQILDAPMYNPSGDQYRYFSPKISGDGKILAFTGGTPILEEHTGYNAFIYNMESSEFELASRNDDGQVVDASSIFTSVSNSGQYVSFSGNVQDFALEDTGDSHFVRDRQNETTVRATQLPSDRSGQQITGTISGNGRYYAFITHDVFTEDFGVYVSDLENGEISLIAEGSEFVNSKTISIDNEGRFIAFVTSESLVPDDSSPNADTYIYDNLNKELKLLLAPSGELLDGGTSEATISPEGDYIAISSVAKNIVPTKNFTGGALYLLTNPFLH